MKKTMTMVGLNLFFLLATIVFAQENSMNETKTNASDSGLKIINKVPYPKETTFYEFSNGLGLFVHRKPGSVMGTARVTVKNTGSVYEGEYLGSGISHLLEHLVAGGGTKNRSQDEVKALVNDLGGVSNAGTSKEMTIYYIDAASTDLMTAMEILADQMQNIVFNQDEFNSEHRVVRQELLDGESNRRRVGFAQLMKTLYLESPYRHPVIGYLDLLDKLTIADVEKFYRSRYTPNNQTFIIAGDVQPDEVVAKLLQLYKGSSRGEVLNLTLVPEPPQLSPREAIREMDGGTIELYLAWPTVRLSDDDLFALDILSMILTNGESSRLVERVKRDKELAIAIQSSSMTPAIVRGAFVIQAVTQAENLAALQAEIVAEMRKLSEIPVSPEELARAKKQFETSFLFARQEIQNVADSILQNYLSTGDPDFDNQYLEGIRRVKIEDIRRVVNKYIRKDVTSRVLLTPIGASPRHISTTEDAVEGEIQAIVFPDNQLRLLTKQNKRDPLVNIQIFVLGSTLIETDATAGRPVVLAEMLDKGTTTMSRDEIAQYFDSIGSAFNVQAGRNTIYAGATVLKEDWSKALRIMLDSFLNPALSEEEFQKAKKLVLGKIARRLDDPYAEVLDLFAQSLPTASPYHLLLSGTNESVERLTLDDIRQSHKSYFVPGNMIITVFGDMEPNAAAQEVSQIVPRDGTKPPTIAFDRPNELLRPVTESRKSQKGTARGMVAFPVSGIRAEKEYAAMTVLQTILGGYGYPGGWLFEELRKEGLIYRLMTDQMTGPVPGYLYFLYETRPGQSDEVLTRINAAIDRAAKGDIPVEDFQKAKDKIIAYHALGKQTLAQQSLQVALDDLYGFGFAYDLGFNARIEKVTLEDVVTAARRLTGNRIIVTASP